MNGAIPKEKIFYETVSVELPNPSRTYYQM